MVAGFLSILYKRCIDELVVNPGELPGETIFLTYPVKSKDEVKMALLKACFIAKINAQLISESAAIVNSYIYNKILEV